MTEKILVVRVGRVGDTVMMTAAPGTLLKYYPDAEPVFNAYIELLSS